MKKSYKHIIAGAMAAMVAASLGSCSDSFLEQEPLSFYEPTKTYSTEAGLQAALAICDRHLQYLHCLKGNGNQVPMSTHYQATDLGLFAKTDAGGSFLDNFDGKITPTSGMGNDNNDINNLEGLYNEMWSGVKYANTVLSYVDNVPGLDAETRDAYKGRAYFHRALRYYYLGLMWNNVPLITKIMTVPKQNYRSCSRDAIFTMLVGDLEFAVKHVPTIKNNRLTGSVNQETCMMLLIKCYLAMGEFAKAEAMATDLIDNHGLSLMQAPFGSGPQSGEPNTWKVERNVMWDLFRGENVASASNTELIMPILNFNDQNFTQNMIMRAAGPNWDSGDITDPSGMARPVRNYSRNDGNYKNNMDWLRVIGRGIGVHRTSWWYNKGIWCHNGEEDTQDMRHNREMGNWIEMEDLTYNDANSPFRGKHLQLYATEDYKNAEGKVLVEKGRILCNDTLRCWYPFPLYKMYVLDQSAEKNMGATQFNGATKGDVCSNGNVYLYRLAEAYLLRAEARVYQGKGGEAAADLNVIRRRANAKYMYTNANIGDVCDERGRELYWEEWRKAELVRISWALARSGRADERGVTYSLDNWDKQEGTDLAGGSYWYQRCVRYNIYNHGPIKSKHEWNFVVNKHNLFWPIPNSAITANNGFPLAQNFGYDGYNAAADMWTDYNDAIADEDRH